MKQLVLWASSLMLLAACSGEADQIKPGMWETTSQMTDIEIPGMPPEVANQMKAGFASQTQTASRCITPEQAANPAGTMLNQDDREESCTFSETTFAGGKIDVSGTCPGPEGAGSANLSWTGSYTAESMEGEIVAEVQTPSEAKGEQQTLRMRGTLRARRTGDCPADAA